MVLPERTTLTTITFSHPFSLTDVDGVQPAGNYTVETIDTTLDNLSFIAYLRIFHLDQAARDRKVARQRQVIFIDPWNSRPLRNEMLRSKRDAQSFVRQARGRRVQSVFLQFLCARYFWQIIYLANGEKNASTQP